MLRKQLLCLYLRTEKLNFHDAPTSSEEISTKKQKTRMFRKATNTVDRKEVMKKYFNAKLRTH